MAWTREHEEIARRMREKYATLPETPEMRKKRLRHEKHLRDYTPHPKQRKPIELVDKPATLPDLPAHVDPQSLPPRRRIGRPVGSRPMPKELLPLCPRCQSSNVKRAGFDEGRQRYKCRECSRSFGGPNVREYPVPVKYGLLCYRCGNKNNQSLGFAAHSGRTGYCPVCRKRFTQGGRNELARYHLALSARVEALKLPPHVAAELLQSAYHDVLMGECYCWNAPLNARAAWRSAEGNPYQPGSSHPAFRAVAEGLPPLED